MLVERYAFAKSKVTLLLDKRATRASIMDHYLSYAGLGTKADDRLVVFFAGHGHTAKSRRGNVGFLVPIDGDTARLSSLIRWDELTKGADLISAKHILFLMDACYGGLAVTRALKPGSMRFLKDMLIRPARQVLTAGKADEVVADLGGPRPDHSVFTGHLLDALEGRAADSEGLLTANGVMAYVYQKVARDPESEQTPHFGYLDGDGDLIFSPAEIEKISPSNELRDEDVLVSVPAVLTNEGGMDHITIVEKAKEYLSDERYRLKLHDLLAQQLRELLSLTAEDHFAVQGTWSHEEFLKRLDRYEKTTAQLLQVQALVAFWGAPVHYGALAIPTKRLCGRFKSASGLSAWLSLRWYPALLLLYSGGIAAVAAEKYDNLSRLLQAVVADPEHSRYGGSSFVCAVTSALSDLHDAFKLVPGHERQYTSRSEYLFKLLQPSMDDLLFLGDDYERCFDRFEVLYALEHAEQYARASQRIWGPIGRFGWKFQRGGDSSPFHRVMSEAEQYGSAWPPLLAGMFGGSFERFKEIATDYGNSLSKLGWW